MKRIQKTLSLAIICAEISHVFCCVLPTLVSVMSLLAGGGVIGSLPLSMLVLHDVMHDWELPIIVGSGVLLALGWVVMIYSRRLDCHDTGCGHEPCTPKKRKSSRLLEIATILFVVNVTVYAVFHRGVDIDVPNIEQETHGEHNDHSDHHDHHGHDH